MDVNGMVWGADLLAVRSHDIQAAMGLEESWQRAATWNARNIAPLGHGLRSVGQAR